MKLNNIRFVAPTLPNLQHIFFDFDGVFTPNSVIVNEQGHEAAICSRFDGLGLSKLKLVGLDVSILSSEENPIVKHRAKKLDINVNFGVNDKLAFATDFVRRGDIKFESIGFVGNDENDLELLTSVGLSFAPSDSWPTILDIVDFITDRKGGQGCVREICEFLYQIKQVQNDY